MRATARRAQPLGTVPTVSAVTLPTHLGSCRICAGATWCGFAMCTSCRDVAVALGRPPVPVTPVALVSGSSPLYRALRQYKSGEHRVAARQRARLSALLDRFFALHGHAVAPQGVDVCVVVPSPLHGRPPPHPLATVVEGTGSLPPLLQALAAGVEPIVHRRPSTRGYRLAGDVTGRRVLLLDDLYTSGAHLQSAAATLADAGAGAIHAVTLGRFVPDHASLPRAVGCRRRA